GLMDIGRLLLNDNFGMFLFILPQIFVNALVYAYTLKIMTKMKIPVIFRIIFLVFYAMFPLLAINSITYIKDTLFYLIFLLFFVYFYYHFYLNRPKKSNYIILTIILILLYLFRNTGYYIAIITLIAFFIYYSFKKDRTKIISFAIIIGMIFSLNIFYHHIFLPKLNIREGNSREMFSIPLQQTARYLRYYPNDLSENEKKVLINSFSCPLDRVSKIYNPNRSDNVKWCFSASSNSAKLNDYFKTWFMMFFKHPLVYIDASLNNTYGYFYPNVMNFINEELGFYYIKVKGRVNKGDINIYWNELTAKGREKLYNSSELLSKTPFMNLLYTPAFYVWILIFVSFYLLNKKQKEIFLYFVPLYVVILTCIISPVNGHMRYLQPLMVSTPFLISILFKEKEAR
ncbi:MAG: DUF6020 family protein, partial [Ruminococcus sp.]|nr:DUF6020 family protein [Ruminococcus sp.]